jgi:hypothetical protein
MTTAGRKISELPTVTTITGAELFEAVQNGVNIQLALSDIPGTGGGAGSVVPKTMNYQVLLTDDGSTFTTQGASADVTLTLPANATTEVYRFIVAAAHLLTVAANPGAIIATGELLSSSSGSIGSDGAAGGLYSVLTLQALSSTLWVTTSFVGPWTPA